MFRRGRFDDLIERQLDLFAVDQAPVVEEAEKAAAAWTHAKRNETEELYGDYQLVVDELADRLHETRESYAGTLDEKTAEEYRTSFNRAATKRLRRFAGLLDEDE